MVKSQYPIPNMPEMVTVDAGTSDEVSRMEALQADLSAFSQQIEIARQQARDESTRVGPAPEGNSLELQNQEHGERLVRRAELLARDLDLEPELTNQRWALARQHIGAIEAELLSWRSRAVALRAELESDTSSLSEEERDTTEAEFNSLTSGIRMRTAEHAVVLEMLPETPPAFQTPGAPETAPA